MRIGVNLLNFGPGVSPESLAGWTQLAETLGYHFVMISDHVAMTPDVVARYPAPYYDPFVTLAWLARATQPRGARHDGRHPAVSPPAAHRAARRQHRSALRRALHLRRGRGLGQAGVRGARRALRAARRHVERLSGGHQDRVDQRPRVATPGRSSRSATCARGRARSGRRTRRSGSAAAARPPCGAPCGSAMRGTRSASASRGCATPGCRSCARSRTRKAGPCRPCVRGSACTSPTRSSPDDQRIAGEGASTRSAPTSRRSRARGEYVLLDTYTDDAEATRDHEKAWRMLALLAERVLDLPKRDAALTARRAWRQTLASR